MKFVPSAWTPPDASNPTPGFSTPLQPKFPGLVATDRAAREEILHRAYSIWECAGRPDNCGLAHWLEAEAEVVGSA
jgi:hypothetical protein